MNIDGIYSFNYLIEKDNPRFKEFELIYPSITLCSEFNPYFYIYSRIGWATSSEIKGKLITIDIYLDKILPKNRGKSHLYNLLSEYFNHQDDSDYKELADKLYNVIKPYLS